MSCRPARECFGIIKIKLRLPLHGAIGKLKPRRAVRVNSELQAAAVRKHEQLRARLGLLQLDIGKRHVGTGRSWCRRTPTNLPTILLDSSGPRGTGSHTERAKSFIYLSFTDMIRRCRKGFWCPGAESNHRHCDFQSHALPTELPGPSRLRRLREAPYRGASALLSSVKTRFFTPTSAASGKPSRSPPRARRASLRALSRRRGPP